MSLGRVCRGYFRAAPIVAAAAPVLPPEIPQYFVPVRQTGSVTYQPAVIGAARILFSDDKLKINESRDLLFATPSGRRCHTLRLGAGAGARCGA